jgi:hypothetical protein
LTGQWREQRRAQRLELLASPNDSFTAALTEPRCSTVSNSSCG